MRTIETELRQFAAAEATKQGSLVIPLIYQIPDATHIGFDNFWKIIHAKALAIPKTHEPMRTGVLKLLMKSKQAAKDGDLEKLFSHAWNAGNGIAMIYENAQFKGTVAVGTSMQKKSRAKKHSTKRTAPIKSAVEIYKSATDRGFSHEDAVKLAISETPEGKPNSIRTTIARELKRG